jgi:mono/diheme cytochrome c family protein
LETRFLVKNSAGIYGVTYRWGDSTTNATLVPEGGTNEALVINDGGTLRTQVWQYPSRVACTICHTPAAGFALGFNTAQLCRDHDYGGSVTNQIVALSDAGYFNAIVSNRYALRTLAHPTNELVSLEYRVRSYLAANCIQCHQPSGLAPTLWDARITTQTPNAGLVNGALVDDGDDPNNRVLVPGSISNSMLLTRISMRGSGQMPPLSSSLVDTQAVALLSAWVTNNLPSFQTFAQWQNAWFGSTNSPDAAALADPDVDGGLNQLEFTTGTNPTNALDVWKISITQSNNGAIIQFPQVANRAFEVQSTPTLSPGTWSALDVPANAPFFSISNHTAVVSDPVSGTNGYYRVRVYAP